MTDKSISEQMREWIKAEKAHPIYRDVPYDTMCRYILEDLRQEWLDKVEALEREKSELHKNNSDLANALLDDKVSINELKAEFADKDKLIKRLQDMVEGGKERYKEDTKRIAELAEKVEALERELKATHVYLADEKRRREEAERENQKLKAQVSTMQQSMLKAIENRHEK